MNAFSAWRTCCDAALSPAQTNQLDKIDASAHHLLHVINDILDLSKIEAGKVTSDKTTFTMTDMIQQNIMAIIGGRATEKGLSKM